MNEANIADFADFIASSARLNKAYNYEREGINALKRYREQPVIYATPTLDTSDISQKYNTVRNTLKSSIGPNTYADLALQEAVNQNYGQQLVNLDMQEGNEISNRVAQNRAETLNLTNQNRVNETTTANNNSK